MLLLTPVELVGDRGKIPGIVVVYSERRRMSVGMTDDGALHVGAFLRLVGWAEGRRYGICVFRYRRLVHAAYEGRGSVERLPRCVRWHGARGLRQRRHACVGVTRRSRHDGLIRVHRSGMSSVAWHSGVLTCLAATVSHFIHGDSIGNNYRGITVGWAIILKTF